MVKKTKKPNGSGLCECGCGMLCASRFIKNHYQKSDKGRKHNSESKLGNKCSMTHGESILRREHMKFKKQGCEFGCDCDNNYLDLHHEPHLNSTVAKTWEGKLITLCRKCHANITKLKITDDMGVYWSLKQTNELLK